jgi:TonB family protein
MRKQMRVVLGALLVLACGLLPAQQDRHEQPIKDEDIVVISFEELRYPAIARTSRVQGVVVVKVNLDETGKVVSATAISGSKMLISDSLSNAQKWRFRPSVGKNAVIVYDFRLADGRCDPTKGTGLLFVFREPNIASITSCMDPVQP